MRAQPVRLTVVVRPWWTRTASMEMKVPEEFAKGSPVFVTVTVCVPAGRSEREKIVFCAWAGWTVVSSVVPAGVPSMVTAARAWFSEKDDTRSNPVPVNVKE